MTKAQEDCIGRLYEKIIELKQRIGKQQQEIQNLKKENEELKSIIKANNIAWNVDCVRRRLWKKAMKKSKGDEFKAIKIYSKLQLKEDKE